MKLFKFSIVSVSILIANSTAEASLFDFNSRFFELSWREEVQLSDAQVIVVQRKTMYERLGVSFDRPDGATIARDSELTFDAGCSIGDVKQIFKGMRPMFLGRSNGVWYAVLYGNYYAGSRSIPGQDWGELEGPYGQWAIKLSGRQWLPISMTRLPAAFQHPNIMLLYGTATEHAKFSGRTITLAEKADWFAKYPPGYSHFQLTRPQSPSKRADWVQPNSSETAK